MKRILFALAMVGCLFSLSPRAHAATEVTLNFFYDNLSPYGNWIEVGDYGYCFQPNVAVNDPSWRPYSDGYWAYTDVGWTWVSYEDFGWATYHYGRWADLEDLGWVWVPGYDWGPAWVSWRTGGDYIGWAPLPPTGVQVYEGRAITGHVDVEFDIGPLYYNFVDIRYIGEPVLRARLIPAQQNVTIINRTVNVTNITYNNSIVYNYGPDLNRVNQFSSRPVQRLKIQRETEVTTNVQGGRGNLNRVNGDQFVVVAPPVKKSAQAEAPKQVKTRVQQAKVEHGWKGVQNREQLQAQMKSENPKNIPPPSAEPRKGAEASGSANTAGGNAQPNEQNAGAGNAAASPNERPGQRAGQQAQRNRGQNAEQNPNVKEDENRQAQRPQQPGQRRAGGPQNQPSANQDQDQQNAGSGQQGGQPSNRPNRSQRPQRSPGQAQPGQSPQERDENAQGQGGQRERTAQPQRNQQADADQSNRARGKRPEASQPPNERADQNRSTASEGERAGQRQRAQQPQRTPQGQRGQEAQERQQPSQPQGQNDQNSERKGKKKKPNEAEPTP
jgi:hypothetical protein